MTSKHRLAITDDDGTHNMACYVVELGSDYENADLSGLEFIGQHGLKGKCFRRAKLYWSILSDADFSLCDFRETDFCGSVLRGTSFRGSDLRQADFKNDNLGRFTDLRGADLSECLFEGAMFVGAVYNAKTKFPVGFDPKREGMVSEE